jgi:hypothetical protein
MFGYHNLADFIRVKMLLSVAEAAADAEIAELCTTNNIKL